MKSNSESIKINSTKESSDSKSKGPDLKVLIALLASLLTFASELDPLPTFNPTSSLQNPTLHKFSDWLKMI